MSSLIRAEIRRLQGWLGHLTRGTIPLQLKGPDLTRPAEEFCHPTGNTLSQFLSIVAIIMPARAPNHHVVQMDSPLFLTEMLDHAPFRRRRNNGTDPFCFIFF